MKRPTVRERAVDLVGEKAVAALEEAKLAIVDSRKVPAAAGARGGRTRARRMTAEERSEASRTAAKARWARMSDEERTAAQKKAHRTRLKNAKTS